MRERHSARPARSHRESCALADEISSRETLYILTSFDRATVSPKWRERIENWRRADPKQKSQTKDPLEIFIRESLQQAVLAAEKADFDAAQADTYRHLSVIAKSTRRAADAIDLACKALADIDPNASRRASDKPISPKDMRWRILQATLGTAASTFDSRIDAALERGSVLLKVIDILREISSGAEERRIEFAKQRTNPGEPARAAFHRQLWLAWQLIYGKRPSKSVADSNPIFEFTLAGWQDYKGEDATASYPSFAAAHRACYR